MRMVAEITLFILAVALIVAYMTGSRRRPHRVKLLTDIQIALTVVVVIAFVVDMKMASWLHSMDYADPVRQEWQPRFTAIGGVIWFGAVGSWLLFTVFHLIFIVTRKR